MNAQELKAVQAPLKAAYREEPGKAVVTLRAEARALEGSACRLETAQAIVEAGLHRAGGDGNARPVPGICCCRLSWPARG
jgi:hypothetical protein